MTHIIQSPKPRKQGATFADVPITRDRDSLCLRKDGCLIARVEERNLVNAKHIPSGAEFWLDYDEPVTLLSVQPIDPEPDPGVCTFEELKPGEWFADGPQVDEQDRRGLHLRGHGDECTVASSGAHGRCHPRATFRRVSASVVEHEEPGATIVRAATPHVAYIIDGDESKLWPPEALSALVRKAAHILAQQAASPESGEPEPAEGRCEVDSRCTRPAGHGGCCWSDTWHEKQGRSKPAPGYTVCRRERRHNPWVAESSSGLWMSAWPTKSEAIARTWWHDAQQAGRGGE